MADSGNPFLAPKTDEPVTAGRKARPRGEFGYILTCLVLTVLWGAMTVINQGFYLIGWLDNESPYILAMMITLWIVLVLLAATSVLHFFLRRLTTIATSVQIVIFAILCYTSPFAIWASVQLYLSWRQSCKKGT